MAPMDESVAVTRIYERHGCFYVEGRVLKAGAWLDAKFTVFRPDVQGMSRDEFMAFCERQLPNVTVDLKYGPRGEVLV